MTTGNKFSIELGRYQTHVDSRIEKMQEQNFVQRLWNKDESLWIKNNLQNEISAVSLGWLNATGKMLKELPDVEKFCRDIQFSGFDTAVLLGMGGSSMAPLVFQKHFKNTTHGIKLIVLDTTDPKTIKNTENEITISKTLFIVSSKSGGTAEVMALYNYFFDRVYRIKKERAGENFIAITDEGSPLAALARQKKFRKLFINFPDIGGRFSVLSYFGIIPAALMGINVRAFLKRTLLMVEACSQYPISKNPGVLLGATIAELALQGCNKLTYLIPPELATFGLWLEQLLAESTGKNGKGILPINGYPINENNIYGKDRLFFSLNFSEKQNTIQSEKFKKFSSMNYPAITISIQDELDLGQEFFRWEIAVASAGAILQINPFDQPDVQESKKCTDHLLKKVEQEGALPEMVPALIEDALQYYMAPKEIDRYTIWTESKLLLENFFALIKPGNYIALQAYLPGEPEVVNSFSIILHELQKTFHLPTTMQFGPRYLHSTGQFHKGGPNTGFFIHFICDSSESIEIPGQSYTFGLLKRAQAIGDMQALIDHERNVILIDLGKNYMDGLNSFTKSIKQIEPVKKTISKLTYTYSNVLRTPTTAAAYL